MDSWLSDCVRPESSSLVAFVDWRPSGRADEMVGDGIGVVRRKRSWDKQAFQRPQVSGVRDFHKKE